MSKKKAVRSILAVLLGVTIVLSATYAWYTTKESVENEFKTANTDNVIIVEEFEPPDEWMPGEEVDKKVLVAQTGTGDVVVRVKLTELLKMLVLDCNGKLKVFSQLDKVLLPDKAIPLATTAESIKAIEDNLGGTWTTVSPSALSAAAQAIQGLIVRTNGAKYLAYYENPIDPTDIRQVNIVKSTVAGEENDMSKARFDFPYYMKADEISGVHTPELHDVDHTMIHINFSSNTFQDLLGWTGSSENWYYGGDGYYYYGAVIGTGQATKLLLESVYLDPDAGDAYKNIEYILTVNMEAVQATGEAVKADWSAGGTSFDLANPDVWAILQGLLG